jgi:hypothetical protein
MECEELSCKIKSMNSNKGHTDAMYGVTPFVASLTDLPNC